MADTEKSTPSAEGMPSLSDAIDRIMANPELISMVASALGKPPPAAATTPSPPPEEPPTEEHAAPASAPSADALAAIAPLLSSLKGGAPSLDDDRSRLLCALKPYVNPHRRDAIDTLLRFSKITDLLKHLS